MSVKKFSSMKSTWDLHHTIDLNLLCMKPTAYSYYPIEVELGRMVLDISLHSRYGQDLLEQWGEDQNSEFFANVICTCSFVSPSQISIFSIWEMTAASVRRYFSNANIPLILLGGTYGEHIGCISMVWNSTMIQRNSKSEYSCVLAICSKSSR